MEHDGRRLCAGEPFLIHPQEAFIAALKVDV
jgi:hypothetical protein